MGLVSDKDKFEKDIKDTLEDVHEPVVSATLAEKPRYSLRLVDKEDIDVDDDYVFAKIEEKIEKKYRYYNLKEDDKLLAKVSTKEEKDKLIEELKKDKNVKDIKVEEEETKENYIISYEEAKQLAFSTAENIENDNNFQIFNLELELEEGVIINSLKIYKNPNNNFDLFFEINENKSSNKIYDIALNEKEVAIELEKIQLNFKTIKNDKEEFPKYYIRQIKGKKYIYKKNIEIPKKSKYYF